MNDYLLREKEINRPFKKQSFAQHIKSTGTFARPYMFTKI